jgi:hypothetical protein
MYVIVMEPLLTFNVAKTTKIFNNGITHLFKKVNKARNDSQIVKMT